jgi:NAD(P)-dependent dehydrogenase (short-subunit alcohol dehydrogenase family)
MTITPDLARLDGRIAAVTGASRGIGRATALGLRAFGAELVVCDREPEGLASLAAETAAATAVLDVRDTDAVEAWLAEHDRVDILVNNAGGGFHAWFAEISGKGQKALVDENFTSVTNCIRSCLPKMPEGGSIINVTSVEAFRAAPGFSIYAAMKAGVEQLTRSLALELSPRRIRVNCVAPDAIPTPGDAGLMTDVDAMESYGDVVPLGLGHVDDCAAAVVFLAGPMARFLTGTTIHVDGGTDAARGWRRRPDGGWSP